MVETRKIATNLVADFDGCRRLAGADAHYDLGDALRARGDSEDAIQSFHRALDLDAAHFRSLAALGQMMKAAGRKAEAAEYFQKALALQLEDTDVLCGFAD